jgi:GR25 family glycosyltransferase involved in LPS biosynthesis
MFVFLLLFVVLIVILIIITTCYKKQNHNSETYSIIEHHTEGLQYRCISLPFRRHKFERMKKMLNKEDIDLKVFDGISGRELHVERYHSDFITSGYKKHLQNNPKQKGHLGATFSHVGVLQLISDDKLGRTVVFEDDCIIKDGFRKELLDCIQRIDVVEPNWDILQLGFSCSYESYHKCRQNDNIEIQSGKIIKLGYAIGLFGYVVNGERSAQKLLKNMFPISWHIDHHWQNLNAKNKIKLYATIPNLVFHPGKVEISSFNQTYVNKFGSYISDTNL